MKDEEGKFQSKYQHFMTTTLVEWSKTAPQRYASFKAMRAGDQTLEEALAAPIQSVGRYLAWTEASLLATQSLHNDHQLLGAHHLFLSIVLHPSQTHTCVAALRSICSVL